MRVSAMPSSSVEAQRSPTSTVVASPVAKPHSPISVGARNALATRSGRAACSTIDSIMTTVNGIVHSVSSSSGCLRSSQNCVRTPDRKRRTLRPPCRGGR